MIMYIFIFFLMLTSVQHMCAMDNSNASQDTCHISITEPEFNPRNGKYTINLFDEQTDTQMPIGYISYLKDTQEPHTWKLDIFRIHSHYRKGGLGLALFKECISEVKNHQGTHLYWDAQPLDNTIELNTLIGIYQKLVLKSGFSRDALTITAPDKPSYAKFVTMRLRLA